MKPLLIRADANATLGTGHVMRCLALAQVWRELGGPVLFVGTIESPVLLQRLHEEGMDATQFPAPSNSVKDAEHLITLATKNQSRWIVVDGYCFDAHYQEIIKHAGFDVLWIDDYGHAKRYCADLVLNQNLYAEKAPYRLREPDTHLLLGSRYTLLRHEFSKIIPERKTPKIARHILVTLGGGDRDNVTLKVVHALEALSTLPFHARVIAGMANPHIEELREAAGRSEGKIEVQANTANIAECMAWADLAVSAGGGTCWELAYLGVPHLMIVVADNQRPVAASLSNQNAAINLGWHENLTPELIAEAIRSLALDAARRMEFTCHAQRLIDGKGSARVVAMMQAASIHLRRAQPEDCRLLWEWANDPTTREVSFSTTSIPWENHTRWFEKKINDPNCHLWIALEENGEPAGQVRLDIEGEEADISISLDCHKRGLGYGTFMIRRAVAACFRKTGVHTVHAYIKMTNRASIRVFEKADFVPSTPVQRSGELTAHYLYSISALGGSA